MNVKKIMAATMPEAMRKVRTELGDDAVILNSRVVYTGGFLGFFKKKNIEVIAALDEFKKQAAPTIKHKERKIPAETKPILAPTPPAGEEKILAELAELKKTMSRPSIHFSHYPEEIQSVLSLLERQELDEQQLADIGDRLLDKWRGASEPLSEAALLEEAKKMMIERLSTFRFTGLDYNKKFIALAGPTGVGKTTTLAKLAAHAMLKDEKKIGFITLDTYRIAAIEQLKTYAQLLHVPVEVVYKREDFQEAAERLSGCDLIFIDTAGRNYRQAEFIRDLQAILTDSRELDILLVLSLSMKESDMNKITDNFKEMPISQFIFTKADETATYGSMINMMLEHEKGAAYLTTGQDVPDDIRPASPGLIADYLFGAEHHE